GELPLQRGGHGRGHGVRVRPGQIRGHLDGGEVHVGQVAHGELRVGEQPEDEDGRHHERGGDGAPDEGLGDAHGLPPAGRACTRAPETRPSWPSTTTVSPAVTPRLRIVPASPAGSATTGRCSTVWSGLTTNA